MKRASTILRNGHTIIASLRTDLTDQTAMEMQSELLDEIVVRESSSAVIDVSGLDLIDSFVARVLGNIAASARLMGAETVVVGMRPEVAMTLVELGVTLDGVATARDLDAAMALLDHTRGDDDDKTLTPNTVELGEDRDLSALRAMVRIACQRGDLSRLQTTRLLTATSEVARNCLLHAGGGRANVQLINEAERMGVIVEITDRGPGIADVSAAITDGFSTRGTMGLGLGGARRLVDAFTIDSEVGEGTVVRIGVWTAS